MDAATAGLVGAFGGALIGLAGALLVDQVQSRRALRTERQRAFAAFMGALYPAVAELRDMPPNRSGGLFERFDSLLSTPQAEWARSRQAIAKISPLLFGRIDRLLAALALLQVMDFPEEVMAEIDKAVEYVERLGENRTPERVEEWPVIRERLLDAGDRL